MKLSILAGSTSQTVNVFIQDSSSTTGAGLAGLVYNSAGLTAYYALPKAAAAAITLATLAAVTSAYSSGGFKEIDATNMPGWYRFDIPDAALASGRFVSIHLKGATNMAPLPIEIELTATNNQSATAFITGVNSLAPPANWNLHSIDSNGRVDVIKIAGTTQTARDIGASVLLSSGTGTGQLDFTSGVVKANAVQLLGTAWLTPGTAGTPDVNAKLIGATAQTGRDLGASVLLSAGTGTGQLDFTSGVVKANLVQILATALTETAGLLAGGFKKFFNVASPTLTCLGIDQTGDNYARLGAPAGASVSADVAAVKVDSAAVKVQTDKFVFTVANQVDSNVLDWKSATAPAMTGDAFARIGAVGAGLTGVPWNAAWDAEVQSEVDDALNTAMAELSQGAPSATPTLRTAVMLIYMALRNKLTTDASWKKLFNDAGVVICKKALSDDATTYTETEAETGP